MTHRGKQGVDDSEGQRDEEEFCYADEVEIS